MHNIDTSLVCICIPNYNNANTLAKTLDNLIVQTYPNIIIKIFDNASDDNSKEVINQYSKKYKNIFGFFNDKNIGGEGNFTKCIENMEGKYGAIYHSDDMYDKDIVSKCVDVLENNNVACVTTFMNTINMDDALLPIQPKYPKELLSNRVNIMDFDRAFSLVLQYGNFFVCPSGMGTVDMWKKIKCFDAKRFSTSSDLDVFLRFAKLGNIAVLAEPLINYRTGDASYSYRRRNSTFLKSDMMKVIDYYMDKNKYSIMNYELQILKDICHICKNKVIHNKFVSSLDIKLFKPILIKSAFANKANLRVFIMAFVLKCGIFLGLNSILRKLLLKRDEQFYKGI